MIESENIVCRLCLKSCDSVIDIFDPNGTYGILVWKTLNELLQLDVSGEDGLPVTICGVCLEKTKEFKCFKETCVKSKMELMKALLNKDHPPSQKVPTVKLDTQEVVVVKEEVVDSDQEVCGSPSSVKDRVPRGDSEITCSPTLSPPTKITSVDWQPSIEDVRTVVDLLVDDNRVSEEYVMMSTKQGNGDELQENDGSSYSSGNNSASVICGLQSDNKEPPQKKARASARVSSEQREIMLRYMQKHPILASGRISGPKGAQKKTEMWQALAQTLNRDPTGGYKSADKWARSWHDWRTDAKQKAARIKRHLRGPCDGKPSKVASLTDIERRLLNFIGHIPSSGIEGMVDPLDVQREVEGDKASMVVIGASGNGSSSTPPLPSTVTSSILHPSTSTLHSSTLPTSTITTPTPPSSISHPSTLPPSTVASSNPLKSTPTSSTVLPPPSPHSKPPPLFPLSNQKRKVAMSENDHDDRIASACELRAQATARGTEALMAMAEAMTKGSEAMTKGSEAMVQIAGAISGLFQIVQAALVVYIDNNKKDGAST